MGKCSCFGSVSSVWLLNDIRQDLEIEVVLFAYITSLNIATRLFKIQKTYTVNTNIIYIIMTHVCFRYWLR